MGPTQSVSSRDKSDNILTVNSAEGAINELAALQQLFKSLPMVRPFYGLIHLFRIESLAFRDRSGDI